MSAALTGHADRPVSLVEWHGRPAAVKHYRDGGAENVARTLDALWRSSFGRTRRPPGLPALLALDGRRVVMERVAGAPAGRRGALGGTARATEAAAALLADLHCCGVEVERRREGSRIVGSLERKLGELQGRTLRRLFADALDALDGRALEGELVVSHGDFSPRNVLLTSEGPRLIDFDRCQMAPRERDVTYWGAWAWATLALGGTTPSWLIGDRFELAYASCAGRPNRGGEARAAHRAAALLRIAHGWSALRERTDVAALVVREARTVLAG